jgi:hypothetical protein
LSRRHWAQVSTFQLPKAGNTKAECQDAVWLGSGGIATSNEGGDVLRVVVADGASGSTFSGRWARHIVRTVGSAKSDLTLPKLADTLDDVLTLWPTDLLKYRQFRESSGAPLLWFEEWDIDRGPSATLLVVQIERSRLLRRRLWKAVALGDACLFHVRGRQLLSTFPLVSVKDFGTRPPLFSSRRDSGKGLWQSWTSRQSFWRAGDTLYAATDALSEWFMARFEAGEIPWEVLPCEPGGLADWVAEQRSIRRLRNDDVTLVRIDLF